MRDAIRSLLAEPRVPEPPARVWRDWALVAVLVPAAILEGIFREDLVWRPVAVVLAVGLAFTLLWRRTHPLAVVAIAFGAVAAVDVAALLGPGESVGLYTTAAILLLPYALLRWASGREAAIVLPIMLTVPFLDAAGSSSDIAQAAIGTVFFLFPAALGASIRYRNISRLREMDQVKLREREQLARELHDTVAHHVSAIAIQAQAGRTLAASQPDAAVYALEVIEEAASRTLTEMRAMVGALRDGAEPDLVPQRGLSELEHLAHATEDAIRVEVELRGDLADLRPSVEATIYRMAQESITNVRRHARHASRVLVRVTGAGDRVHLTVHDDGDTGPHAGSSSAGYGLVGMAERAKLLGGSFEAGPQPDGGWATTAVLPKTGSAA